MAQIVWRSLLDNRGAFIGLDNYVRYAARRHRRVDHQQPVGGLSSPWW